jgi:nucleotide-binding universal stress UspA family protein
MFRTILVPLDGSPFAEQALPWALSIARRAGAQLDLVRGHVLYALVEPASAWVPYDPVSDTESKEQEQLYLEGTARWVTALAPVPVSTAVVPGLQADGLLERARARKADLVVMATHGRGPLGRFFFGSLADQLVRCAAIPVLLIHRSKPVPGPIPEPAVQRVLIPLDGSALAERVLGPATELARLLEVPCTLLRFIEPEDASHGPIKGGAEAEATSYLRGIADRLRERGLVVDLRVLAGRNAAEAILEQARSGVLIALATHGRGGLGRILLGSVADRVIRAAPCPVLVYRPTPG